MIRTVFEYIAMLQKCGPQAWFYSELRDIENIKFRFREEVGFVGVLMMMVWGFMPSDVGLTGFFVGESLFRRVFSNRCNV